MGLRNLGVAGSNHDTDGAAYSILVLLMRAFALVLAILLYAMIVTITTYGCYNAAGDFADKVSQINWRFLNFNSP